jgi:hypothetical protein
VRGRVCLIFLAAGCGRLDFDGMDRLIVGTAVDRMAGPLTIASPDELPPEITELSLREAVAIAANRPGPDLVEFDPDVFPATAPAVIPLGSALELGAETTVDATDRGVVLGVAAGYDAPLVVAGAGATGARWIGTIMEGGAGPRIDIQGATGVEVSGTVFRAAPGIAVRIAAAASSAVRGATIQDPTGNAIEITGSVGITIEDTSITLTLGDPIIAVQSTELVIQRNTILIDPLATGRGVVLDQVERSRILDNFIDPGSARLVELQASRDNEIIGNILDRGDVGIGLFAASTGNLVLRNVIIASGDEPMYVDAPATGNRVLHNTLYLCGAISDLAPDTQIENNLDMDQGFVDPAAFDFHLAAGNAALDAGTDLGLDLLPDRPERFLGPAPDLGAVETQ